MRFIWIAISLMVIYTSCKKDDTGTPVEPPVVKDTIKSDLSLEFDNRIKDDELHLALETYTTEIYAEQFTVTALKYFISNIILTNTGDTTYTIPQDSSYFLIDENVYDSRFANLKVPVGDYKTISFVLGVDSLRNINSSMQTGVLDRTTFAKDMYWGADSGYIFFKLEGTSPASPQPGNIFSYHVGGFGGVATPAIKNQATVTIDLTQRGIAEVRAGNKSNIHLMADISRIFDNRGQPVRIADHPVITLEEFSSNIAYNYSGMFRHDHTEN